MMDSNKKNHEPSHNKNAGPSGRLRNAIRPAFNFTAKYLPGVTTAIMALPIAKAYFTTGRLDLLIGGSLLSALGMAIVDATSGKNYLSRAFQAITGKEISPGTPLAALGLASCLVLGGGEAAEMARSHGLTLYNITNIETAQALVRDPSFYKILANAGPFALSSLTDIPSIFDYLSEGASETSIRDFQTLMAAAGSAMIGFFGVGYNIPSAINFGAAGTAANLTALAFKERKNDPPHAQPPQPTGPAM